MTSILANLVRYAGCPKISILCAKREQRVRPFVTEVYKRQSVLGSRDKLRFHTKFCTPMAAAYETASEILPMWLSRTGVVWENYDKTVIVSEVRQDKKQFDVKVAAHQEQELKTLRFHRLDFYAALCLVDICLLPWGRTLDPASERPVVRGGGREKVESTFIRQERSEGGCTISWVR